MGILNVEGNNMMQTFENSGFLGALYFMYTHAADKLEAQDKITFSKLAGLPTDRWESSHREMFALSMMHYLYEVKISGQSALPNLLEVAQMLPRHKLPPLPFKITNELKDIIIRLNTRVQRMKEKE